MICKLPGERMNWTCDGTDLWALQDEQGLCLVQGKALVIKREYVEALARGNPATGMLIKKFGLREFIDGPHMHLVWNDGMRGLKLR